MTNTIEQLLASHKAAEEERRKLMNQNTNLQNQIQKATEGLSEVCQQLLEITRQKDELADELTILKANYCGSLKSRKMK
jgi:chromosome segregation ATPase